MKKIAVLLIATRKYKTFLPAILAGIERNFLTNHDVHVHLFVDTPSASSMEESAVLNKHWHVIPSYGFPEATLYRYKIFSDHAEALKDYDHIFYLDVDMAIDEPVGDELLLGDFTAVRHPGFFISEGWGSSGNDPRSRSHIEPQHQKKYYAGGFQGGKASAYLLACQTLSELIELDAREGVMAVYHDETFWNYYLNFAVLQYSTPMEINELTPSYCSVPSMEQRKNWGIDNLPAKIIALDKNHAEIRS